MMISRLLCTLPTGDVGHKPAASPQLPSQHLSIMALGW